MHIMKIDFESDDVVNCPAFSFDGIETHARVLDIYDGDTLTVALPIFEGHVRRFKIRLLGIDAPELRGGGPDKHVAALSARDRLIQLVLSSSPHNNVTHPPFPTGRGPVTKLMRENVCVVFLQCGPFDKYGRILARVYGNEGGSGEDFSDILIREGMAQRYGTMTKMEKI